MKTDVITKLILNTCEPYIIKYPSPSLDTNSSPIITPIKDILMFILNAFIMFCLLLGKITLENICHLVALKLFNNII